MEINKEQVYAFLDKLRYIPAENDYTDSKFVDHINKVYSKEKPYMNILVDTIFFYTPPSVFNLVKYGLENIKERMSIESVIRAIEKSPATISTKYRQLDLIRTLHPWISRDLQNNLDLVLEILLSKAIDSEDNYFNPKFQPEYRVTISTIFNKYGEFLDKAIKLNLTLSGSTLLACYGNLYREKIKDFDFVVDSYRLNDNVLRLINDELTTNRLVGKRRIELERKLKDEFMNSSIGKELKAVFEDELELINCMIDRLSTYDYQSKATFIFNWHGIEFDLMFRDNIKFTFYKYKDTLIKIQDHNDVFYAKRCFGRPKDFQDFMNFMPYTKLNNNGKCVVKYE